MMLRFRRSSFAVRALGSLPATARGGTAVTRWLGVAAGSALLVAAPIVGAQTPADMPANSWLTVPGTRLDAVQADPGLYAELQGNGFPMVVEAWNGAVLDTTRTRLVVWGGGHNDYYGNEMYAFDIGSLTWSRLTEPTVSWTNCGDPNPDGTANSRHTYNGMAYVAHADRFFVSGGALNCTSGSCGAPITWVFDFVTSTWTDRGATGSHTTGCENNAAYDPASKAVYFGDAGGLYAYRYDQNTWEAVAGDSIYAMTSTVDTSRGTLVMAGGGEIWAYDLAAPTLSRQVWQTTGGDAFLQNASPGFDYDPVTDRFVGWSGGAVYVLDPETLAWTTYDPPGAPSPTPNGIFGRWRYVPVVNAFVLVTATDVDVHFFKLSEGGMLPPPAGEGGGGTGTGATTGAGATPAAAGPAGSGGGEPAQGDASGCDCSLERRGGQLGGLLPALAALGATAVRRRRRM